MKHAKITFTLPHDLADFVDRRIEEQCRLQAEPENTSKYLRDLIREDKRKADAEAAKKKKS